MARSDHDVYEHLLARGDLPIPLSMLAFAYFAEEKRDWMEHFFASGAVESRAGKRSKNGSPIYRGIV